MSGLIKKIIKKFVEKGCDLNALNANGYTPLTSRLCGDYNMMDICGEARKILRFLLDYSNINTINMHTLNSIQLCSSALSSNIFLEHLAKIKALNTRLCSDILEPISESRKKISYFEQCTRELLRAKNTKLHNSWVTYYNLLVDNKKKIKNYAGNEDLLADFQKKDCVKMFSIYGAMMKENVKKGVKRRKLFDESAGYLSDCWKIFNPSHLVIKDVLDFLRTKDLSIFCSEIC